MCGTDGASRTRPLRLFLSHPSLSEPSYPYIVIRCHSCIGWGCHYTCLQCHKAALAHAIMLLRGEKDFRKKGDTQLTSQRWAFPNDTRRTSPSYFEKEFKQRVKDEETTAMTDVHSYGRPYPPLQTLRNPFGKLHPLLQTVRLILLILARCDIE